MQKIVNLFFKLLEFLVVVCMVAMVFMVFGHVVLRYGYGYGSGIDVSDEMVRYFFIWLTDIGAMLAMREKGHLGVDTLVMHLGIGGKKLCLFLSEALMLACNLLFVIGTWRMHAPQVSNVSPAVGMPIAYAVLVGGVTLMGLLAATSGLVVFDSQILAQRFVGGADNFPLLAVPFFMLADEVMNAGGLGYVTVVAAVIMASLSGSAVADSMKFGVFTPTEIATRRQRVPFVACFNATPFRESLPGLT